MGGDIQAQGHAQVLINLIDRGLNLQQAIDAPRVRYISGRGVMMEDELPPSVIAALVARGHERVLPPAGIMHRALMGGGQAIMIDPQTGALLGRLRHPQGRTRHWLLDASPLPCRRRGVRRGAVGLQLTARRPRRSGRHEAADAAGGQRHPHRVHLRRRPVRRRPRRASERPPADHRRRRRVEPGVLAGRQDDRVQRAVRRQHRRLHRAGRPAARRRG